MAWASGKRRPSKEGPSSTPAIISPTTWGWPRNFWPSQPTTRQVIKITANCRKKWMLKSPGAILLAWAAAVTAGPWGDRIPWAVVMKLVTKSADIEAP